MMLLFVFGLPAISMFGQQPQEADNSKQPQVQKVMKGNDQKVIRKSDGPQGGTYDDAPPPPPPPPPPPAPETPGFEKGPHSLDLPDLTKEQLDQIHKSDLDHMKAMTPLKNQVREKKMRLQTVLTSTPFDAKAADALTDELSRAESAILKELIRHDRELRSLLTPDQQVIFDSRMKPFLHRK